ncbi:BsuPI-related putative proteinase inhibitor [Bacillus suaedae]|uniref:Intracellular proteinase inhibitor BsuPI domain-containing protein n=1 Tax=Halalkalibacter suaedae TaxID=2822140 RepID=A0A940X134_9BACI|nr:BsuPI-related putative proteinase inhibitor [Bacillus suaedae]MBP3953586.1 hypothetical protein [Bacillus suaedae]
MTSFKSIALFITLVISLFLLVTCGGSLTPNQDGATNSNNDEQESTGGIHEGTVNTAIESIPEEEYSFHFHINNDKTEAVTLEYTSSQEYDYHILDDAGKTLATYSMNKSFLQTTSEKTLDPGEVLTMDVDITEFLPQLEEGTYVLEIWPTVVDLTDLKATIEFDYDGKYVAEDPLDN